MTTSNRATAIRLDALEDRVRRLAERPRTTAGQAFEMHQFTMATAFGKYDTWRHQGLSLEERLALARDDATRDGEKAWAAIAVREIEIRILERDRKVDAKKADDLRRNAREHFRKGAELDDLPRPVKVDQEKALKSALKRCPRRESLPVAKQRELIEEDYRQRVAEAEQVPAESGNGCVAVDAKGWRLAWADSIMRQALQDVDGNTTGART